MRSSAHPGRRCVTSAGRLADGVDEGLPVGVDEGLPVGVAERLPVGVAEGLGVSRLDAADAEGLSDPEGTAGGTVPFLVQPPMPITSAADAVTMMLRCQPGPKIMFLP
jgi:hypothetical protein